jgi:hypothetical protein
MLSGKDQTILFLKDEFELDKTNDDMNNVRQFLIEKIQYLLSYDTEKLWWVLYRIDISENKAIEALQAEPKENGVERLADLIIERQIQKVKTRREYQSDAGDWQ